MIKNESAAAGVGTYGEDCVLEAEGDGREARDGDHLEGLGAAEHRQQRPQQLRRDHAPVYDLRGPGDS